MAKRIDSLQLASVSTTNQPSTEWGQRETGNVEQQLEQVQYMHNTSNSSQNDFHGDTYNSSWKNHPNLRWGDNQNHWQKNNNSNHSRNTHSQNLSSNNTNQYKKPQNTYQPPHNNSQTHQNNFPAPTSNPQNYHTSPSNNFQQQQSAPIIPPIDHHENRISSLEAALQTIAQSTQTLIKGQERYEATMKNLERQVGQLAKQTERPTNVLPSDIIPNPREECKAVQLRSGKIVGKEVNKEATKHEVEDTIDKKEDEKASTSKKSNKAEEPLSKLPTQNNNTNSKEIVKPQQEERNEGVKSYTPKLPYPTRIHKGIRDQQFPKFLEIFKKLEINIPLAEALEQMPLYAKFLKELITKKRSWQEKEIVFLTQKCSAIIQKGLPPKLKDPGSFLIPCTIGNMAIDKSLCDLGASINLMPLAMMKKLMIEEVKPTRISLQLADRSLKIPNGVVENLLIKVENFIFPADFVVLDMDKEGSNSVILGRPFLATARTIIDVEKGEMIFRVHDE
ncbi:putative uncharacterized protein DDB_G0282133 [Arachis ipaensis]|uniref:putative uncharacterized protein DDB_G0282133 n=1 Tax=Arachis ipaensis TaxID=130454 RepID=UPI0007AFA6CF|nr:putative uncharacterized protein DDB_G0282133 [Arachis ipaensis]